MTITIGDSLRSLLLGLALLCFVLVVLGLPSHPRLNWLGLGLAFWVSAVLFTGA